MRLEWAHLMNPKRFEHFFRNYSSSKDDQLQILQMIHLKTTAISKENFELLCAASSYVEIIDLASKLRELNQKWRWSRSFLGK